MPRRKYVFALLTMLTAMAGCARREAAEQPYRETRHVMGTLVAVSIFPPSGKEARELVSAAFAAMERVDRLMSDYRADSELSRVNAAAGGEAVPISKELRDVLVRAAFFSRLTEGAFDPTIRPLVKLWQQCGIENRLPTENELDAANALVDWKAVSVLNWTDVEPAHTARLARPGMQLDLGGIAKGYAVDHAIATLRALGVSSALVDAGGDLYALGSHPDGSPWKVGIQDPNREGRILSQTLLLKDRAVATSGDYRRFAEIQGKRYSHIIDPRTGRPAEHMASVTVVAANATDADALSTAFTVLGPEKSLELAKELPGMEVMMLVRQDDGKPRVVMSDGFSVFLSDQKK